MTRIKRLIFSNLAFHFNHFILIYLVHVYGLNGFVAVWFFSPFVLLMFTSSMLDVSVNKTLEPEIKRVFEPLKKLSILDFFVRLIGLLIHFFVLSGLITLPFLTLIIVGAICMLMNLFIEWKMFKRLRRMQDQAEGSDDLDLIDDEITKEEMKEWIQDYTGKQSVFINKFPDEKQEIRDSYTAITIVGYSYVLIFLLIAGGIMAFEIFGEAHRLIILMVAFLLLGVYIFITNMKLDLFYKDRNQRNKIRWRDNFTFIIGISIVYILQGYIHIGTGTFNFLGIFIAILFLIPTLKTNGQVREQFIKMNRKHQKK